MLTLNSSFFSLLVVKCSNIFGLSLGSTTLTEAVWSPVVFSLPCSTTGVAEVESMMGDDETGAGTVGLNVTLSTGDTW